MKNSPTLLGVAIFAASLMVVQPAFAGEGNVSSSRLSPASQAAAPPGLAIRTDADAQALLRRLRSAAFQECRTSRRPVYGQTGRSCVDRQMADAVAQNASAILSANYDSYVAAGRSFRDGFRTGAIVRRPRAEHLARYAPARAFERERSGGADLECIVRDDYRLNCSVISESSEGWGFGEAALQASNSFRARSHLDNGASTVGTRVRIPIVFLNDERL